MQPHTDTPEHQQLTITDFGTNQPVKFEPVHDTLCHVTFEHLDGRLILRIDELLLVAQMLAGGAAEAQPRDVDEAVRNDLRTFLNGGMATDELVQRIRSLFLRHMPGAYIRRMHRVLDEIAAERARQVVLLSEGRITHDCANAAVSDDRKLRTATEELGEVAEAIDLLEQSIQRPAVGRPHTPDQCRRHLRKELIQLAAVLTAWAESLTHD